MRENTGTDNENSDDNYVDSFFDDAILEIAGEIAQIKAMTVTVPDLKSDPQITLKVEMELKKVDTSPINITRILKSVQEVEIDPGINPIVSHSVPSNVERQFIHSAKGFDKKYHPLTITESMIDTEENLDYHNLTLEDLFEDLNPEETQTVVVVEEKIPHVDPTLSVVNHLPQIESSEKKAEIPIIKTINIPNVITRNLTQQLKDNERKIFKSLMKMDKSRRN